MTEAVLTGSEAETVALGRKLARQLKPGSVVLLYGGLGMGKTAFVRGLAEGLEASPDDVSSPTFAIVQEYRGRVPLYHVDLYRVDPREVQDLALEELSDGVMAVEWADRLPQSFEGALEVTIEDRGGDTRRVSYRAARYSTR